MQFKFVYWDAVWRQFVSRLFLWPHHHTALNPEISLLLLFGRLLRNAVQRLRYWKRSLYDQKENGNDTKFSKRAADGYSFDAHHAVRDIRRDKCFSTASLPKTSS